jgi:G:T-mismatch repair DNA endonuclease (very short patch repair protein)
MDGKVKDGELIMIIEKQMAITQWNNSTKRYYLSKVYQFTKLTDEFEVKIEDLPKKSKSIVKAKCDWCNKIFERKYQLLNRHDSGNHFCSNECQHEFRSYHVNLNKPVKTCERCRKEYKVENYNLDTSRFCSLACMSAWQSEVFKGEGSSKYVDRIKVNCDWCKEELFRTPSYLKNRKYNFCNEECRTNFHREVYMQMDEVMERNRQTMLNNLSEGKIKFTETKPHLLINELLKKLGIRYKNETVVDKYAIDIYLIDYDLLVEINGGFWHCDNRLYKEINYKYQLNRVIEDKKKSTFIKNKFKKNILYLWELDITTDIKLCEELIIKFVKNGILSEYHSMNYTIDEQDLLSELGNKYKPYMYWSKKELAEITDLSVREKRTGFQPDKHITFNCDQCGIEKTQLIKQYEVSKNHFCSVKCHNEFQKGKTKNLVI